MDTNKYLKKMLEMDRQRFKLDNERFLEQQRASRNAALGGGFGGVTGMTGLFGNLFKGSKSAFGLLVAAAAGWGLYMLSPIKRLKEAFGLLDKDTKGKKGLLTRIKEGFGSITKRLGTIGGFFTGLFSSRKDTSDGGEDLEKRKKNINSKWLKLLGRLAWPLTIIVGITESIKGAIEGFQGDKSFTGRIEAVSYTHLTLPTIYSV